MSAAQWSVVGVIFSLIVGAITLYFLARSNARENQRQRDAATKAAVDDAVREATVPLNSTITSQREEIAQLRLATRDSAAAWASEKRDYLQRIRDLEDELRRGAK